MNNTRDVRVFENVELSRLKLNNLSTGTYQDRLQQVLFGGKTKDFSFFGFGSPSPQKKHIEKKEIKLQRMIEAPEFNADGSDLIDWDAKGQCIVALGKDVHYYDYKPKVHYEIAAVESAVTSLKWASYPFIGIGYKQGDYVLFDIEKNEEVMNCKLCTNKITAQSWNYPLFFVGDCDGWVSFVDIRVPHVIWDCKYNSARIRDLKMYHDNRTLASTGDDGAIRVWDIRRQEIPIFCHSADDVIFQTLSWSSLDHGKLFIGGKTTEDYGIYEEWNVFTNKKRTSQRTPSPVTKIVCHQSGMLVIGQSNDDILFWDADELEWTCFIKFNVVNMMISPDQQILSAVSDGEKMGFWNCAETKTEHKFDGFKREIR